MRFKADKTKFIKTLEEMPFISNAAKKTGISRATIYRWLKDDINFRKEVDKSLKLGRDKLIDITEMSLLKAIEKGNIGAIKFFLANNDRRYMAKRTVYVNPRDLKPGETCETCGHEKVIPVSAEELKKIVKDYAMSLGLIKE